MTRVEWSRYPGVEIETVIAIMLCREYLNANRPKPHQGDGGIDLLVPTDDGAVIYQVKGFTGNLTSTQKSHIKKSWETFLKYSSATSLKVSEWHLVIPENLTNPQREWLKNLTKDASFPCHLHTLDYCDGLAAKYPDVIDYYLRDGKERLESAVKTYLSIVSPATSTEPAATQQRIADLHRALNQFDPHYRYDYAVDSIVPGQDYPPMPTDVPWLVAAVQLNDGDRCITYKIFARFAEAANERPVPGKFTIVAEEGSDLEAQVKDWAKFGAPLLNVPARDIVADLPGGFATNMPSGYISLRATGPISEAVDEITISLADGDGNIVGSLDFTTDAVTTGHDRRAVRCTGHERLTGVVTFELRISPEDMQATIQLTLGDITGKRPSDVLPSVRFIAEARPSRNIRISVNDGPSLVPPTPLNSELIPEAEGKRMIAGCEALAAIQKTVFVRIVIPDLAAVMWDELKAWVAAAAILRGEEVHGTWKQVQIHLPPGTNPVHGVGSLSSHGLWPVKIGNNVHSVGNVEMRFLAGRLDETRPPVTHEDHLDVWCVPAGTDAMTIRLAPERQ